MTDHPHRFYGDAVRGAYLASVGCLIAFSFLLGCTKETSQSNPSPPQDERLGASHADPTNGAVRPAEENRQPTANADGAAVASPTAEPGSSVGSGTPEPRKEMPEEPEGAASPKPSQPSPAQAKGEVEAAPPPAEVYEPKVVLSDVHTKTCVVGVGDQFPNVTLPDVEGNSQELFQLLGDRMTIVVFWNSKGIYAREQFSRIMSEIHNPYQPLGIQVVAINVGDAPDVVQQLATSHGVTLPCLLDADQAAFHQVATDLLPRTYLLDAEGRILWFDIEYSRGQRLGLHNAVYYHLKQSGD